MTDAKTAAILRKIAEGSLLRKDAAVKLGCSERQVNRLMRKYGVRRPVSDASEHRRTRAQELAALRERRLALAGRVAQGRLSHELAAEQGEMSVRTVYRLIKTIKNTQKMTKKQ